MNLTGLLIAALALAGGRMSAPPPFTLGEITPPAPIERPAGVSCAIESPPSRIVFRLSGQTGYSNIDAGFELGQLFSSTLNDALRERNALFRIMTIEFEGKSEQLLDGLVTGSLPPAEQLRLLKIKIANNTAR